MAWRRLVDLTLWSHLMDAGLAALHWHRLQCVSMSGGPPTPPALVKELRRPQRCPTRRMWWAITRAVAATWLATGVVAERQTNGNAKDAPFYPRCPPTDHAAISRLLRKPLGGTSCKALTCCSRPCGSCLTCSLIAAAARRPAPSPADLLTFHTCCSSCRLWPPQPAPAAATVLARPDNSTPWRASDSQAEG